MTRLSPGKFAELIKAYARGLGFELVGIAEASEAETFQYFQDWLDEGYAGEMRYMEQRRSAYEHPEGVMPGVKSVIMLGLNYRHVDSHDQSDVLARISIYAQSQRDYHHVIREKLKLLAKYMHSLQPDCITRGVVDTAPLLERDFARRAGLGWFGKNTLLINKQQGSFLFLAGMLTNYELPSDETHHTQHCGTCTRCLEACPTGAFVKPYQLDARKCISYLTIELRDQPIPSKLRSGMENWMMGCDVCQDVCPWNHKAQRSVSELFKPQVDLQYLNPAEFLQLSELEFKQRYQGTPLARPGRIGILRNLIMVIGNRGKPLYIEQMKVLLKDESPIIRGAIVYAFGEIAKKNQLCRTVVNVLNELRQKENDPYVISELDMLDEKKLNNITENEVYL